MDTLLEITKRGLQASRMAMDVIGNNIANASTPGYSQQRLDVTSAGYQSGGLSIGLGVNIQDIQRLHDNIIDQQIRDKQSQIGSQQEQQKVLQQLQSTLSTQNGQDLDQLIGNFFNSFSNLSNQPEDNTLRNNVINQTQALTSQFHSLDSTLTSMKGDVATSIRTDVTQVNGLLSDIATLNKSILSSQNLGHPDNQSLDQRAQKLQDLSKLVNFTVLKNSNNDYEIRIGGMVVLHNDQSQALQTEEDTGNNQMRVRLGNGKALDITGGSVGANITNYDKVIPGYQNQLNSLAKNLVEKVNAIHQTGYDMNGNTGVDFFDPNNTTAKTISLNSVIQNNPQAIAASDTSGATGNNKIALQIYDLGSSNVINGQTLQQNATAMATSAGSDITNLTNSIQTLQSAKNLLDTQQASTSGVNLDEQLTNMIKYQNAYQATARVLNTSQQMFQSLISIL
ncbi:MAG TPA: flagellar hook-associated protein FlgK [Balneolales bacterium]|nr:flagellar hook-associated protein FlgK [Balneolales bacterium]